MLDFLAKFSTPFFISTFKYMFSAGAAVPFDLTFVEAMITISIGSCFSFCVFYFSASYFMKLASASRVKKEIAAKEKGNYVPKKKFTKTNKFIVKIKTHKAGFWLVTGLCPLLLSVPLGSILVAKFFGGEKRTFLVGIGALILWSYPITAFWYIFN